MIAIGQYNELRILRHTSVGLYLGDEFGEDVLLPNKYCPEKYEIDDVLNVFVYLDSSERKIATNLTPKILLHEFAFLRVTAVEAVGAFMDWGLEKGLMVPFKEQRQKMELGRWYVVYLDVDTKTNRLFASNKIDKFLKNETENLTEGDMVSIIILQKTDLGFSVIVNNRYKGLVYDNEIYKSINVGDRLDGYVKKIREDGKLDISLQPIGYLKFNDANCELVYQTLQVNNGFLPMSDKSSPEEIYSEFGISKKAFKKSIGALYKEKKINIEKDGIRLISG